MSESMTRINDGYLLFFTSLFRSNLALHPRANFTFLFGQNASLFSIRPSVRTVRHIYKLPTPINASSKT